MAAESAGYKVWRQSLHCWKHFVSPNLVQKVQTLTDSTAPLAKFAIFLRGSRGVQPSLSQEFNILLVFVYFRPCLFQSPKYKRRRYQGAEVGWGASKGVPGHLFCLGLCTIVTKVARPLITKKLILLYSPQVRCCLGASGERRGALLSGLCAPR